MKVLIRLLGVAVTVYVGVSSQTRRFGMSGEAKRAKHKDDTVESEALANSVPADNAGGADEGAAATADAVEKNDVRCGAI